MVNHVLAICDYCRRIEVLATKEGRDWWLQTHPCPDRDEAES